MKWNAYKTSAQRNEGFSLIELLVSVALFTVVMTVSVGTLLALVSANQKAQSLKSVTNNLNFALESMSRTIRTGRLYYCANGSSIPDRLPTTGALTRDCATGESGIVLTDDQGARLAYRRNGARIERKIGNNPWIPLTADEVVIEGMRFYVTGTRVGDLVQPTATISIRGQAGPKVTTESAFNIQTTVTQRVLDE